MFWIFKPSSKNQTHFSLDTHIVHPRYKVISISSTSPDDELLEGSLDQGHLEQGYEQERPSLDDGQFCNT